MKRKEDSTDQENPADKENSADKEKPTENENYTEAEAAKWLRISRATLQRARYRKEISYYRMGNNRNVYASHHLKDY